MNITFVQTADPIFYDRMLAATSRTVKAYCLSRGLRYESFLGIKRGVLPWHAAYNRVYLLKEMIDRDISGWVFYLDADAYIGDMSFDIRSYLSNKNHLAGIFAGYCGSDIPYVINSGGFAINLSHVTGRSLAYDYWKAVEQIPAAAFNGSIYWEKDILDDQQILHETLKHYVEDLGKEGHFLFERVQETYVNYGPFIKQSIRAAFDSFDIRMRHIEANIDGVMADRRDDRVISGSGDYIPTSHPRMSTVVGSKHEGGIATTGEPGTLVYGPYIQLKAGSYIARVFGEIRTPRNCVDVDVHGDVISPGNVWSVARPTSSTSCGTLLEHRFDLPLDQDDIEVRVHVGVGQDVDVHAVQILRAHPVVA